MACLAGSARTSYHNFSFLEGPKSALLASSDFHGGRYYDHGLKNATAGTQAFGRVYSTWALDQEWFRQKCWETEYSGNCKTLEEYLQTHWAEGLGAWDANDLLCLLWTWQNGDVSAYNGGRKMGEGERSKPREGDLKKALQSIRAKCLIVPSRTDTYFPPRDSEIEIEMINEGEEGKAKL
jgi:homoserine acetyltransferase